MLPNPQPVDAFREFLREGKLKVAAGIGIGLADYQVGTGRADAHLVEVHLHTAGIVDFAAYAKATRTAVFSTLIKQGGY